MLMGGPAGLCGLFIGMQLSHAISSNTMPGPGLTVHEGSHRMAQNNGSHLGKVPVLQPPQHQQLIFKRCAHGGHLAAA